MKIGIAGMGSRGGDCDGAPHPRADIGADVLMPDMSEEELQTLERSAEKLRAALAKYASPS